MVILLELLSTCLVAFGIVAGGSLCAGLAAQLGGRLPMRAMVEMADQLKLWGTFAALGGTFTALKGIESGLFSGETSAALRQMVHVLVAFGGAHLGYILIRIAAGSP